MRILLFALCLILAACGGADYPNLEARTMVTADGKRSLEGWSITQAKHKKTGYHLEPNDNVFDGAKLFYSPSNKKDPRKAFKQILKREGMKSVKILKTDKVDKKLVRNLDPYKKAKMQTLVASGKINGKKARAIGYVWRGKFGLPEGSAASSGVHVFMAPKKAYEALGGFAVPGVYWFGGQVAEGEDMRDDGKLSSKKSVKKLTQFAEAWLETYENQQINDLMAQMMMMQTMNIQAQTLNNMMSYNNALNTCAGSTNCTVEMDGTGGYYADID